MNNQGIERSFSHLFSRLEDLEQRIAVIESGNNRGSAFSTRFTHSPNIRITLLPGGSQDDESTWEKVTLRRGNHEKEITVPYTKAGLAALIAVRDGLAPKRKEP